SHPDLSADSPAILRPAAADTIVPAGREKRPREVQTPFPAVCRDHSGGPRPRAGLGLEASEDHAHEPMRPEEGKGMATPDDDVEAAPRDSDASIVAAACTP
ncbi:unnamed protein product, partial [Sphacelaria rigidula]